MSCVLKYSASFAGEQLHSLSTSLSKVLQALRRIATELNKPQARWQESQIRSKVQRWLSAQSQWSGHAAPYQFLEELIRYQIESRDGRCGYSLTLIPPPGSDSSSIVWAARFCSPTTWNGPLSKWLWVTPANRTSRESFVD